jgi:hypothetical protein
MGKTSTENCYEIHILPILIYNRIQIVHDHKYKFSYIPYALLQIFFNVNWQISINLHSIIPIFK